MRGKKLKFYLRKFNLIQFTANTVSEKDLKTICGSNTFKMEMLDERKNGALE